jgi:hypothetical protein
MKLVERLESALYERDRWQAIVIVRPKGVKGRIPPGNGSDVALPGEGGHGKRPCPRCRQIQNHPAQGSCLQSLSPTAQPRPDVPRPRWRSCRSHPREDIHGGSGGVCADDDEIQLAVLMKSAVRMGAIEKHRVSWEFPFGMKNAAGNTTVPEGGGHCAEDRANGFGCSYPIRG